MSLLLRRRGIIAASAAAGEWSPLDLPDLVGWWDASDTGTITDAGSGKVSQWNDKSGNGYHLTQGTDSVRPLTGTRTVNGLNVLEFVSDDILTKTGLSISGMLTVFTVGFADTGGSCWYIAGSGYFYHSQANDGSNRATGGGSSVESHSWAMKSTGAFTSSVHLMGAGFDTVSDTSSCWMDGAAPHTVGTLTDGDTYSYNQIWVGKSNFDAGLDGVIGEFVVCNTYLAPGDDDYDAMDAYCVAKWGTP